MDCGRVFFTVSVEPWVEGKEPTKLEVAARLAAVVGVAAIGGGFTGFAIAGLISGLTSYRGIKKSGVYANGRTLVVRGQTNIVDMAHLDLSVHGDEQERQFNNNGHLDSDTRSPVTTTASTQPTLAEVSTTPVASHPFYSEEADGEEVGEVVFNMTHPLEGVVDDESHEHTEDYIQL
eukprot:gene26302-32866_t